MASLNVRDCSPSDWIAPGLKILMRRVSTVSASPSALILITAQAGIPQFRTHGLRQAGTTIVAENGATDRRLMALAHGAL